MKKFALLTISLVTLSATAQMDHSTMPGMQHPLPPALTQPQLQAKPAQSITRDVEHLQEAENPTVRTGADLPAPELLTDVTTRTPITLDQWQHWAEEKNPTLAQARALQTKSQQLGRQSALPPNPTVGYSGEHIRGGSYSGGEQGAYFQQTIVTGGKLGLKRDIYTQQATADAIGIQQQTYRVRADVGRAFYRALAAQSVVTTRQRLLQIALDSVATSHAMANLGQVDSPDVLQSEVEAEQAKMDYVEAQRMYLQAFRILAANAGDTAIPVSPLSGDLTQIPDLNADAAIAKVLMESPSLLRARQQANVATAQLKSAKREPIPNLNVQAGEWYSGDRLDNGNKARWMSFAQVGVELPLWNRNQGATAAAQAEVLHAQADITRTRLQLQQQAEPLAQQYLTARFQAERYRDQLLPRAQRAFDLYNLKYQQMAAPYPQVLLSQRTLFQLQIAYIHALEQEWMSIVGLQNYTLQGGLDQPTEGIAK